MIQVTAPCYHPPPHLPQRVPAYRAADYFAYYQYSKIKQRYNFSGQRKKGVEDEILIQNSKKFRCITSTNIAVNMLKKTLSYWFWKYAESICNKGHNVSIFYISCVKADVK